MQSVVKIELTDIDAYRVISDSVESAAAKQPGILFHRSYQLNSNTVVVYEEYASSESVLSWIEVFAANSGNFRSLIKGMTYEVFGTPTPECKTVLDEWGATYYKGVSGFIQYN